MNHFFLSDVTSEVIGLWEFKLGSVTLTNDLGERLSDAEKYFAIRELRD
jgi:hypothetical protein